MSRNKNNMSHNACSVYDYNALRWKVQPSDMVAFDDDIGLRYVGEIILLGRELMHIQRLKDQRNFVVSLYDLKRWRVTPVDYVRRLPNGVFSVGESVELSGDLNLPDEEYIISSFAYNRVKVEFICKGRFVGFHFVSGYEVLKKEHKDNEK